MSFEQDPQDEMYNTDLMIQEIKDLQVTIGRLREQVSSENLYRIFRKSFQVNNYHGGWKGDWPELEFYVHEVWKRDPVVEMLQVENKILMGALENMREITTQCEPYESGKAEYSRTMKALAKVRQP